jgi:succinyl-CoA synthetase beta subunit
MNIHEYQAKELLRKHDIPVPRGVAAFTVAEAVAAAESLGKPPFVVKAQIHAGGRGKAGGIKIAESLEDVREAASAMLGSTLVTRQTGRQGKVVHRLYIEESALIARELYLACLIDRATARPAFIASTAGGMDIEEVARTTPEKIVTVQVDPATNICPHHVRRLAKALDLDAGFGKQMSHLITVLHHMFVDEDMSLLEINPLIVTREGKLLCLDAKINFDGNALFRHADIQALRDESEEDPREAEAHEHDLSYVSLDGTIGCMVNGAGLAMATMDIIKLHGAEPANFLDVGGGASKEKVAAAFKIITADERVRGILVNIFGGIMRCDVIAAGVIAAVKETGLGVPLVVRLEGTNVELGKRMLADSGLNVITADNLDDAAAKIVAAVQSKPSPRQKGRRVEG